ncbi:MAG: DMT family transporter [Bacteroidetes bacterium]|nr:MAG: DMT family transporter [Bacteroidota bacterium]
MIESRIGEIAALGTAFCWTITALAFETASRKVGSVAVNIIRLVMAFVLLGIFSWFYRGMFLPMDASAYSWFWLILSGLVGFVIGDLFLFEAFTMIGSRMSMLMMTLVPPITAILGWMLMGEQMTILNITGMLMTMSGIALVIFQKHKPGSSRISYPVKGLFFAFLGAAGQATGYVLSKYGMGEYDPFAATQIRVIAGIFGFGILVSFFRRWRAVLGAVKQTKPMLLMLLGATFGPFIGVSLSLLAAQNTSTGIAATIMAITPILIIPPTMIFFKQAVSWKEITGAAISVGGVSLFFIF